MYACVKTDESQKVNFTGTRELVVGAVLLLLRYPPRELGDVVRDFPKGDDVSSFRPSELGKLSLSAFPTQGSGGSRLSGCSGVAFPQPALASPAD